MQYEPGYAETLCLFEGVRADLRLVRSEDAALLHAGFAALSSESRYLRFFSHKECLSDEETGRLTNLDNDNDLAIGAIGSPGTAMDGIPMGVARFAREDPHTVEAAIVVVDAFRGRGLGHALLVRLGEAAKERGIESLHFSSMAHNHGLGRVVKRAFPTVVTGPIEGGMITYRAVLEEGLGPDGRAAWPVRA